MKNVRIKKTLLLLVALIFLLSSTLFAIDFNLVANANAGLEDLGTDENNFDYRVNIWPSLSTLVGDFGEFTMSAGFTFGMEYDEIFYVPELLQTALTMRFRNFGIRVGRINYSDPLSFIAEGLFDGAEFIYNTKAGRLNIGAWYTGFLYKKNVNILMTDNEKEKNIIPVDYGDFLNTYFAPRRAFASIGWEHPSVGEFIRMNTALIGQIDLAEEDEKYHSQYIVLKAGFPVKSFLLEIGGSLGFYQSSADNNIALAGELGLYWLISSKFNNRISLTGRIASGVSEDICGSFVPITSKYYGFLFKETLSGLSIITLNYSGRLGRAFGTSLNAAYFIRNDLGTFTGYPISIDSKGYFLGPDISAKLIWGPASDFQINLSGGVFLPILGNAGPKEKLQWRVELSTTIAIF
jgi:hypothetical protein